MYNIVNIFFNLISWQESQLTNKMNDPVIWGSTMYTYIVVAFERTYMQTLNKRMSSYHENHNFMVESTGNVLKMNGIRIESPFSSL